MVFALRFLVPIFAKRFCPATLLNESRTTSCPSPEKTACRSVPILLVFGVVRGYFHSRFQYMGTNMYDAFLMELFDFARTYKEPSGGVFRWSY